MEIDVVPTKTDNHLHFQFHDRWLNFAHVHEVRESCQLWQAKRLLEEPDETAVCDCAAEKLLDLMLDEIGLANGERTKIGNLYKDLLCSMPRHVKAASNEVEQGVVQTEITWETSSSKYFKTSFDVFVFPGDFGDEGWEKYRFHDVPSAGGPASGEITDAAISDPAVNENLSTVTSHIRAGVDESPSSSGETTPESSPAGNSPPPPTDYLWKGKATDARSIIIETPHLQIIPGKRYIALIRPTEDRKSIYSSPFPFSVGCPAPQDVVVEKSYSRVSVTWSYPFPVIAQFRVICESIYDTHYISALLGVQQQSFELDLEVFEEELEIVVEALSEDGILSKRSAAVKVPAEEMDSTSPSQNSVYDDCIDDSPARSSSVDIQSTTPSSTIPQPSLGTDSSLSRKPTRTYSSQRFSSKNPRFNASAGRRSTAVPKVGLTEETTRIVGKDQTSQQDGLVNSMENGTIGTGIEGTENMENGENFSDDSEPDDGLASDFLERLDDTFGSPSTAECLDDITTDGTNSTKQPQATTDSRLRVFTRSNLS